MADFECVIVGGGIAGLTAAYHLGDREVLVLESADRLGGRVKSVSRGDYWANLGAQFVAPQGPLAELAALPGVELNALRGQPRMNLNGRTVTASPVSMMLRSGLPLTARAGLAAFGIKLDLDYRRSQGKSDRARVYRRALDDRRASELFPVTTHTRPILEALARSWLSAELTDVSGAHATAFFHHGMAMGGGDSGLTFPTHGSETVIRAVAAALPATVRVQTGAAVDRVTQTPTGVDVEYRQGDVTTTVTARTCVMAAPAYAARELVTGLPAEHREALAAVEVGSFITGGLFTNETGPQPWDQMPMMTIPRGTFQTIFNPVSVKRTGERRPGGSLSTYAGGDRARELMDASDDEVRDAILRDVCESLPLTRDQVDEVVIERWPKAMPYWGPGGYVKMRGLRRPLGRISFAGDYLGLPGMPSAAAAGKLAAESTSAQLSA